MDGESDFGAILILPHGSFHGLEVEGGVTRRLSLIHITPSFLPDDASEYP
jgi:hypothetical protein